MRVPILLILLLSCTLSWAQTEEEEEKEEVDEDEINRKCLRDNQQYMYDCTTIGQSEAMAALAERETIDDEMMTLYSARLSYVSGNICETNYTAECFDKLVSYEGQDFPLYGQGEEGLDETCEHINASFLCIQEYFKKCDGTKECDENCQKLIKETQSFKVNTGLQNFAQELCEEKSNIRKSYLTSYECLKKNEKVYSSCHDQSKIALEYLSSIQGISLIPKNCCYLSWYHDCFSNITQEHCDKEATNYVKFGMLKLVGSLAEKLCKDCNIQCSSPPPHSNEVCHEDPTTETISKAKAKTDKQEESSASIISCPVAGTVVAVYFILFMKLLLY